MDSVQECYFHEDGFCIHTDKQCKRLCWSCMKEYQGLPFQVHFDTYWKRKHRRIDLTTRWMSIIVSIGALMLSLYIYSEKKLLEEKYENLKNKNGLILKQGLNPSIVNQPFKEMPDILIDDKVDMQAIHSD